MISGLPRIVLQKSPDHKFPARSRNKPRIADRCGVRLVTEVASEFITWR